MSKVDLRPLAAQDLLGIKMLRYNHKRKRKIIVWSNFGRSGGLGKR